MMSKLKRERGSIDRTETFDEFLAKDGILAETEDAALKEVVADQIKVGVKSEVLTKTARRRG
jgi:antitoxin HicB